MGKGAPLRWLENRVLRRYVRGTGVEIGALWRQFPLPGNARAYQLDRMLPAQLQAHYKEVTKMIAPNVIGDATELPFANGSLDFIVASHVLEHLPFPLRALRRWHDALRPGGALLLRVPDKRYTFDAKRERTSLHHLLAESEHPERFDREAHFADWVEKVVGFKRDSPEFRGQLNHLMRIDYSIHYHVWTSDDLREILRHLEQGGQAQWRQQVFWPAHFYRKETVAVLRRA